ncbi:carboxypeptidase-like regulatory domain-containing protein [Pedobacter polaris]|uniref:Carboxypeptidase-like regulatory domain-containing protein n=1 Tax=Pedobacter polaris TaxID=2571273 RepID=A0A4U1CWG7_9SPHI|nr:carboxypeptidase-like regulatory domain-containing protein [Pedobacter polaris]TKC12580.1 carboxypeptidase-like regulatory domain-containing protein [Pedobacter polaris]
MMKHLLILFLILLSSNLYAQNINGFVLDFATNLPIENAQVITKKTTSLTDENGKFSIINIVIGEKVSFRIIGYETHELIVKREMTNANVYIKLNTKSINLKEVNIRANRNYMKDSLALRKEYATIFAYKAPNFTDIFVKVDPSYRSPFANINPNSTASIFRFNALSAFSFFGKKKNPTSKLKQTLLKAEEFNFIDSRFSKAKIESLTYLKGDSLQKFIEAYRPTYQESKRMSEYEIILYIKKSYGDFIKPKN